MSDRIADVVFAALSRQLKIDSLALRGRGAESLERLGLDSHGLMRVLLDVERELKLANSLELPDDALESPTTLVQGVAAAVGG